MGAPACPEDSERTDFLEELPPEKKQQERAVRLARCEKAEKLLQETVMHGHQLRRLICRVFQRKRLDGAVVLVRCHRMNETVPPSVDALRLIAIALFLWKLEVHTPGLLPQSSTYS